MAISYTISNKTDTGTTLHLAGLPVVNTAKFRTLRVRPTDWLKEPYLYDQKHRAWNEKDKAFTLALRHYLKSHPENQGWVQRLRYQWLDSQEDELAMLAPPSSGMGYLTFNGKNSEKFWQFICDFRNTLWDIEEQEKNEMALDELCSLGINYSISLPYTPDIVPNDDYKVPDWATMPTEVIEAFRNAFWTNAWASFHEAGGHLETVRWRLKKRTTWGPPYVDIFDNPYSKHDVCFHADYGRDSPLNLIIRPDYSGLKRPFVYDITNVNSCYQNFSRQIELFEKYGPVTADNLHHYLDARAIGRSASNLRKNCPDGTLQRGHISPDDNLFTKDRNLVMDNGDFEWLLGKGSSEKFNQYVRAKYHVRGAANRARRICGFSQEDQFVITLMCDCLLHTVERGASGFLANRPEMKERWFRFIKRHKHVKVAVGDRSNAETFMTSNPEFMHQLWDPGLADFICGVKGPVILPSASGVRCLSYEMASGKATTSFDNILPGNADKAWMYARAVYPHDVRKQAQAVGKIITCLMTGADEVEVAPGIFVCPFLSTDDIIDGLADDLDQPFDWKIDQKLLDARRLSLEVVDEALAYGMVMSSTDVHPSTAAGYKKCFTSEHMGFAFKDGFSTFARIKLTGKEDVISDLLRKHFGNGCSAMDYEQYVPLYLHMLTDLGVDINEEYNEFSPVETAIFGPYREQQREMNHGRYVSEDPTRSSTAIAVEVKQAYYKLIVDKLACKSPYYRR